VLNTNAHVHVFTADQSPEIQFYYLLWNVFETKLCRSGIKLPWPLPVLHLRLEDLARYSCGVRLGLRLAVLLNLVPKDFDDSLVGLVRTIEAMTHASATDIQHTLGMPGGPEQISGRTFLRSLMGRLAASEARHEPYPFSAVLAALVHDLYALHRAGQGSATAVSQQSLLEAFYAPDDGKARYKRAVLLTVNFDCAFQGLDRYGLAKTPDISFAEQVADVAKIATDPAVAKKLAELAGHAVDVRPFLCVDPRYQPEGGLDAWVKERVSLDMGPFKGLKVYPPMGFNPAELRTILLWCKEQSIPVTSHCSMGGAGIRGLDKTEDFADPTRWTVLLDEMCEQGGPGVFRLNLAHFSDLTRSLDKEAAKTWSDEIIAMMEKYQDSGQVEIYSDLGYCVVGPDDWPVFEHNVLRLRSSQLDRWVLFGSDWWNYLPDYTDEAAYVEQLRLASEREGLFDHALLNDNAEWFLGLKGKGPRPHAPSRRSPAIAV